jgi:peptidoglycan/LPS O-acetylase OafA/YrhL
MFNQVVYFLNKPLKSSLQKHSYSRSIEQYRGLCALLVLIGHGAAHEELLVDHFEWPEYVHYFGAGYLAVLVFFCISGYVIGISNDTNEFDIKAYLTKRAVRLYPIYILSITVCIIVVAKFPIIELLGNIFFLQNDMGGNFNIHIFVNYPSWSLNYEALYYLLFIALFFWRPKLWKLLLIMSILSLSLIHPNWAFVSIANYLNGFYFWVLGLIIGWNLIKTPSPKNDFVPLLSLLFLHLCQHHLGLGLIILHTINIYPETNINWLFDLPFCLMIMCILTRQDNLLLKINKIICYALPGCVFLFLIISRRILEDTRWIMCFTYWTLSLMFYFEKKISAFLMEKLTIVGKMSYAIYLLHVPIGLLIKKTIHISDQRTEILVKYSLWILVTFALSALVELVCQPFIKKVLTSRMKPS